MDAKLRALLTRARDDGEASAARLRARGVEADLAPVIEIVAQTPATMPEADFGVATSRHAFLAPAHPQSAHLTLYAVGAATAAAARAAGFSDVREAGGEASALLALLEKEGRRGRALYLAGRDRKPTLEAGLARLGVETTVTVVYAARARDWDAGERALVAAAAQDHAIVLHYSRRSAGLFLDQIAAAGLSDQLSRLRHVALSQDAARPILARGLRASWPARPKEDDLFALLSP